MVLSDTIISAIAVMGFLLVAYSSIKKQTLPDTIREIKEMFSEKTEEITAGAANGLKYAN